jgi:hypothetical protein
VPDSRSELRRIAVQRGEEMPEFPPSPRNPPAGPAPSLSRRGPDAALEPPRSAQVAAAPDAAVPPPLSGIRGPDRADGAAACSAAPSAPGPAPAVPGAEGGKVEPLPSAPARARDAAGNGVSGTSPRGVARGEAAGPGIAVPGPAQASPPEDQGPSGGGRKPGRAARTRTDAVLPGPGLSGEEFRKAVRDAESRQARQKRTDRGEWTAKAAAPRYRPGGNRRNANGGDGAA